MTLMEMPFISDKEWNSTLGSGDSVSDNQANEIIEYFEMFKSHQEAEKNRVIDHTFKLATVAVNSLLQSLKQAGFEVKDIFLRFDNTTSMTALYMVDDDVFCSDKFEEAYDLAGKVENSSRTDIFDITINFASKQESIDLAVLACEGFYMRKKTL